MVPDIQYVEEPNLNYVILKKYRNFTIPPTKHPKPDIRL
jgi:hypothetical protein